MSMLWSAATGDFSNNGAISNWPGATSLCLASIGMPTLESSIYRSLILISKIIYKKLVGPLLLAYRPKHAVALCRSSGSRAAALTKNKSNGVIKITQFVPWNILAPIVVRPEKRRSGRWRKCWRSMRKNSCSGPESLCVLITGVLAKRVKQRLFWF